MYDGLLSSGLLSDWLMSSCLLFRGLLSGGLLLCGLVGVESIFVCVGDWEVNRARPAHCLPAGLDKHIGRGDSQSTSG